jgi:hypothetical protein
MRHPRGHFFASYGPFQDATDSIEAAGDSGTSVISFIVIVQGQGHIINAA